MPSVHPEMFQIMASSFADGDMLSFAGRFCYPTAIFLKEETLVYQSKDELSRALDAYYDHLNRFDYKTTRATIDAVSLTRGVSQSVWVNWQHFSANGSLIEESHIRYFGHVMPNGEMQIQLAEYLVAPTVCSRDSKQFVA